MTLLLREEQTWSFLFPSQQLCVKIQFPLVYSADSWNCTSQCPVADCTDQGGWQQVLLLLLWFLMEALPEISEIWVNCKKSQSGITFDSSQLNSLLPSILQKETTQQSVSAQYTTLQNNTQESAL